MLKSAFREVRARYRELAGVQAKLRPVKHNLPLLRLGSDYGGWWFVDEPALRGSTIISAGLGEDSSFDCAFAERYDAKVVMVDPTPKALAHFKTLTDPRLHLVDRALSHKAERQRFFAPPDPTHVSYSLVNFQNGYATDTASMDVEAVTMRGLVATYGVPPLVKLDIEGACIEVLLDMARQGIRPSQIAVEYDEMTKPSVMARNRVERAHAALTAAGYDLIFREWRPANFLYVLRSRP